MTIQLTKAEAAAVERLRGVPYGVEPDAKIAGSLIAKGLAAHASVEPLPDDGTAIYLTTAGRGWNGQDEPPAESGDVPIGSELPSSTLPDKSDNSAGT